MSDSVAMCEMRHIRQACTQAGRQAGRQYRQAGRQHRQTEEPGHREKAEKEHTKATTGSKRRRQKEDRQATEEGRRFRKNRKTNCTTGRGGVREIGAGQAGTKWPRQAHTDAE